jgi:hypothetical protein
MGGSKVAPPADAPPGPTASMIDVSAVVGHCPDDSKMNSRLADEAIRKLVEPCVKEPGGTARFSVTLKPGGVIELSPSEGAPQGAMVPACALKRELSHKIKLKSACTFEVRVEEHQVPTGAGPKG